VASPLTQRIFRTKYAHGEVALKKSTIVLFELGMVGGIILAGYTLPGNTSLRVFLFVSTAWFVIGNILLVRKIRQIKAGENPETRGFWTHIVRALGILAISWFLSLVLFKR
jgi:hypothetical protein